MGRAVANGIAAFDDLHLAGIWRRGENLEGLVRDSDVVIDFSLPEATAEVLSAVRRHRVPLVCGVSGLEKPQMDAISDVARIVPVVYDRNMSLGIAVLENLVRDAVRMLGGDFDIRVHETHHVHKVDKPSGTALKLGEAIAAVKGIDPGDILYESERRGEVPGDHEIVLSSQTERLTLAHSVTTRDVFAEGALRAARWIIDKPPGMFTMHDVLE
jgi:4-hydroxy-tetrahydrodipicolinate reductase